MTAPPILAAVGIGKRYSVPDGEVAALEGVSFAIGRGEFVSIIGPSGCGKTTLVNIVGGLADGHDGEVVLAPEIAGLSRPIGVVFQEDSLFPWRTALGNVAFPLEVSGVARAEREERAARMLNLVGLSGFERHYPHQLSGGMRQRAAIARALVFEPPILLMDEPFAALDAQTRLLIGDQIIGTVQSLAQTTLLVTHSLAEAVQLSDRVIVLSRRPGRVRRCIDIDLPRPRTSDILAHPRFGELVATLWHELRQEASLS
ncbi:MAG: ABC transporter ATP-binding protein [Bauldia sp.]